MKIVPVMAASLAALASCAAASSPEASGRSQAAVAECALTVRFGSYAMGIDAPAAERIEQYLRSARGVQSVERRPWGKEGEFDLCVATAKPSDAAAAFAGIRPLLPERPHGPITVLLADGRSYMAGKS